MTAGKTSTLALLVGSFLVSAAALEAAPCTPSNTVLCLSAQRFSVEVRWTDFAGNTGAGRGVTLTPDTGYFWFFSESNVELVVKVLDARGFNGRFWVFFGALSNVEYTLTVTDTETGASKTYQNPSGQFASVGDTAAFTGSAEGGIATHETVIAEGTPAPPESLGALQRVIDTSSAAASQDFTPCASIGRALRLGACRFSLEVSWRDFQGREGRGTPVQLTNDTGYFWFFSPSNVELVIKVLDAKSINGSHWVFYGALSNVQYTLTVTDSMTGAVRFYTNPNGTFASVGDTGAFRAGRSIGAVPDSSRTAFATFDSSGGTLSATGPDGTQYELELPPDALGMEMTVRMTPLARVDGLPLSRGLVGAVQLEPEGLRLFVPATLRIRPPHPLRKGIVGFSYHGPGEDFALDLGEASNGEVRVPVLHFSGAGAGAAGAGDAASQTANTPLDTIAYIRQLVLEIVDRAQEHEDENGNVIPPEITLEERYELIRALFIDVVNNVLLPRLSATLPDCHRTQILDAATLALATIQTIQLFTDVDQDGELKALVDEVIAKIIHILNQCLEKFFKDCKAHKDPFIAWDMVMVMRQLELFGVDVEGVLDQGGYIERCLRFRMVFDSAFDFNLSPGSSRRRAYATAKLRMDPTMSTRDIAWSGTGRINLTELRFDYDGCSTRIVGTTESTFEVGKRIPTSLLPMAQTATIASNPDFFTSFKIWAGYDPGDPQDSHSYTCDGATTTVPMLGSWRPAFEVFHANEIKNGLGFLAEKWDVYNLNGLYARANYQRSNHPFIEDTVIVIEHTPDDPDP